MFAPPPPSASDVSNELPPANRTALLGRLALLSFAANRVGVTVSVPWWLIAAIAIVWHFAR